MHINRHKNASLSALLYSRPPKQPDKGRRHEVRCDGREYSTRPKWRVYWYSRQTGERAAQCIISSYCEIHAHQNGFKGWRCIHASNEYKYICIQCAPARWQECEFFAVNSNLNLESEYFNARAVALIHPCPKICIFSAHHVCPFCYSCVC